MLFICAIKFRDILLRGFSFSINFKNIAHGLHGRAAPHKRKITVWSGAKRQDWALDLVLWWTGLGLVDVRRRWMNASCWKGLGILSSHEIFTFTRPKTFPTTVYPRLCVETFLFYHDCAWFEGVEDLQWLRTGISYPVGRTLGCPHTFGQGIIQGTKSYGL